MSSLRLNRHDKPWPLTGKAAAIELQRRQIARVGGNRQNQQQATAIIEALLCDHYGEPQPTAPLRKVLEAAGLSWSTAQRAARKMGVIAVKQGGAGR